MTSIDTPTISVIVPAYNSADYIATALESITSQRHPALQIIVVDDGSSDQTRRVLANDHREITLVSQSNAGPAAARNAGLKLATGRYVAMLDADDWFLPNKLHQQMAILEGQPLIDAVHSGWKLVDAAGDPFKTVEPWRDAPKLDLRDWLVHKPVRLGAMLFRRESLRRVGGFDATMRQAEDTDLMFRLALDGCRFHWLREPTLCYRHHAASMVRQHALQQAECNVKVLDKVFDNTKLPRSARRLESPVRYYTNVWIAWHLYCTGHRDESLRFLRQSMQHTSYRGTQAVHRWLAHFLDWCSDDQADPENLRAMWPCFRDAARVDDIQWQELESELDWWMNVWRHYTDGNFDRGAEQLAKNKITAKELASRVRRWLLLSPTPTRPDAAKRVWLEAERLGFIDPCDQHEVTGLYLGMFGRSFWAHEHKAAASSLLSALRDGYHPKAWPIWGRFAQSSTAYLFGQANQSFLRPRLRVESPGIDPCARVINPEPVAIQRTPDSILANPESHQALFIRGRSRLATCSGVAWFHGDHLATVNVLGRTIHTYRFDFSSKLLTLVQSLDESTGLPSPENLASSPDGRLIAVTDSRIGVVKLFAIDPNTHRIDSNPRATIDHQDDEVVHGISFSPCSRFLAFTTVDEPGQIRIYRMVQSESGMIAEPFQQITNELSPLKPKGIDFSPDGRSVVVCFGPNAGFTPVRGRGGGALVLYAFDDQQGISQQPQSIGSKRLKLMSPDDVKFFAGGDRVAVTQQATDRVAIVTLENAGKKLGKRAIQLQNPQSCLSFPHGVGVSNDGTHLAITNYGDDTFSVYEIADCG